VKNDQLLHIVAGGPSYPRRLSHIDDPPKSLWACGRSELLESNRARLAIVGTRAPTPYGTAQAVRFAAAFARAGVAVVSGLARGIDQAAHEGCLKASGDTLAVLGSGLLRPWPNTPLLDRIAERGLLLSEFEPEQGARPHQFPQRNRIISGLSDGVLVVEAAAASGSLITARWALDQGREVFALPGRVDHPMSRGTHKLLREGAHLVESPEELLAEIYPSERLAKKVQPTKRLTPVENCLRGETLSADELADRLARSVGAVLGELVPLEVEGRVVRAPGGLFRLAEEGL